LYPPNERWRASIALTLLVALIVASALPWCWRRWLIGAWAAGLIAAFWLMHGGAGLGRVPTRLWGGLPITVMLTAVGLSLGFPLAVLLALGRRSALAVPRVLATTFVETVRGVPLIAVLYVAALVVPLALPAGIEIDKLFLAQGAIVVFASAYLSEAVRSGLQVVPRGQYDAARALGLSAWRMQRLVILPQALRVVVPSFVSIAVGFFQDTSLVVIIGFLCLRLLPSLNDTRRCGRVVADTATSSSGMRSTRPRISVPLPAPDGPVTTNTGAEAVMDLA